LVVKLGTGVITDGRKRPDPVQVAQLVAQVAGLRAAGREVVLVSSGAVGAGMGVLGFESRPRDLAELQACAAVGQSRLMAMYESFFRHYELGVGQVLLTHDDLADHARHLNARNTLLQLLKRGVVPVVNENDVVSVTELKFGDNDRLSALVAGLLPADLLVILTTAEGLVEHFGTPEARRVSVVERISRVVAGMAGGTTSVTAVGGMQTKIEAARITLRAGIPMVIASGRQFDGLQRILEGADEGTLFVPQGPRLPSRKRWIAFYQRPEGRVTVDEGACLALVSGGRSLLAPGITDVEGDFGEGALVRVCRVTGEELARGLTRWSAGALRARVGEGEVIHRDDLVVLADERL
jgi:glutamate 5-kinase